jgi:muramidase (phage lysozyme)
VPDADLQVADPRPTQGMLAALSSPPKEDTYQAPPDLKVPVVPAIQKEQTDRRGPSGPTGVGKAIADASYQGLVTPQIAQRAEIPPEAVGLLNWVMSGESKGFNELYNGARFADFSAHPADLGWSGDKGPDGRPTHAAGGPQFEPATWHEARDALKLPDFSDVSQTKAAWWLAQRDYQKNTGRDLLGDLKEHRLDQLVSGLKGTWTSLGKGEDRDQTHYADHSWGMGMADEMHRQSESSARTLEADRDRYLSEASKAPPGSPERMQMLHEAHEASQRATKEYETLMKAPPVYQPTDAFAGFGGILMALAAFAGGRSAQPLTASLNAMSGMIEGMNTSNHEAFDRSYKIWDKQTGYALKLVDIQNQDIRNILEDQRMADAEKSAHLQTVFSAYQMDQAAAALRQGDMQKVWGIYESSERMAREARDSKVRIDDLAERKRADLAREKESERYHDIISNRPTTGNVSQQIHDDLIEEWQSKPENAGKAVPPEVDRDAWTQSRGTGTPRSGTAMAVAQFKKDFREKTGRDPNADEIVRFNAKQASDISLERAFGSGREAQEVKSLNTVAQHLELEQEAANALKNHDLPRLNQINNMLRTELGAPEVTTFDAARSLASAEVARSVIGGQSAVADREHFRDIISGAQSPEQLAKAFDEVRSFIGGRANSLRQQYAKGDKERETAFENEMLTDSARKDFAAANRKASTQESITVPAGAANDPDGTGYRRNGEIWVKHGDRLIKTPGGEVTP